LTEQGAIRTASGTTNFEIQFTSQLAQGQQVDVAIGASGQSQLPDPSALLSDAVAQASGGSGADVSASSQASSSNGHSITLYLVPSSGQFQSDQANQSALFSALNWNTVASQSTNTFSVLDSLAASAPDAASGSASASAFAINDTISSLTYSVYGTMIGGFDVPPQVQLSQSVTDLQGSIPAANSGTAGQSTTPSAAVSWNAEVTQSQANFLMEDAYCYGIPDFSTSTAPTLTHTWSQSSASSNVAAVQTASDRSSGNASTVSQPYPVAGSAGSPMLSTGTYQINQATTQSSVSVATDSVGKPIENPVDSSPAAKILAAALRKYALNLASVPADTNPILYPSTEAGAATTSAALNSQASASATTTYGSTESPVTQIASSTANSASVTPDPHDDHASQLAVVLSGIAWESGLNKGLSQSKVIMDLLHSLAASTSSQIQAVDKSSVSTAYPSALSAETDHFVKTTMTSRAAPFSSSTNNLLQSPANVQERNTAPIKVDGGSTVVPGV